MTKWLRQYVTDAGFRRDLHHYGGLVLLAVGLALVYSVGHALIVAGLLLFALPLAITALTRRSG